jgi:hypothetical protein
LKANIDIRLAGVQDAAGIAEVARRTWKDTIRCAAQHWLHLTVSGMGMLTKIECTCRHLPLFRPRVAVIPRSIVHETCPIN